MIDRRAVEDLLAALLESLDSGLDDRLTVEADVDKIRETLAPLASAGDVRIDWTAVNDNRVDLGLSSGAREWRLVLVADGDLISSVALYEKPERFDGVDGGLAVVVNGPSGSGKTTLMHSIAGADPRPWVVFDEPWMGHVQQPYLIWPDTAPNLHRGYVAGIAAVAATGNQVILSAGGRTYGEIADAFANVRTLTVGIDCPVEVLLERERVRADRAGGLAESSLTAHVGWTYDLRLDSDAAAPAHMARTVLNRVDRLLAEERGRMA